MVHKEKLVPQSDSNEAILTRWILSNFVYYCKDRCSF
ncbi:hypothetical protein X975_06527, partial [Stegodyphus mimosarum]